MAPMRVSWKKKGESSTAAHMKDIYFIYIRQKLLARPKEDESSTVKIKTAFTILT
jgi:hypothetical protein